MDKSRSLGYFAAASFLMFVTAFDLGAVYGQTDPLKELDKIFQSENTGEPTEKTAQTDPLKELDKIFQSENTSAPVELTDRDNDPDDNTVDSIDGPLKIQLALEQDKEYPENYVIEDHTFEFNGLTQQPRNYALQEGDDFSQVRLDSDSLLFTGIGALEIENTTGTITEKDILQVGGFIQIDKTLEDSATGEITHILDYGMVNIGNFDWMDVTGNITKTGNQAIVTLVDRPTRQS